MNAFPDPPRTIRWRWIFALLLFAGVVTWIAVALSPMLKREAAARELRRHGFEVGVPGRGLKGWWDLLAATLTARPVPQKHPWSERVTLISASVESLDPFASALIRFNPNQVRLECSQLRDISALKLLPQLKGLHIFGCPNLTDLSQISELPHLHTLFLIGETDWKPLPPLKSGPNLVVLSLHGITAHSNFDQLREYKNLTHLSLGRSPSLKNVEPLRGLANLRHLDLSINEDLTDVTALHDLRGLKFVNLTRCPRLSAEAVAALRAALPGVTIEHR